MTTQFEARTGRRRFSVATRDELDYSSSGGDSTPHRWWELEIDAPDADRLAALDTQREIQENHLRAMMVVAERLNRPLPLLEQEGDTL